MPKYFRKSFSKACWTEIFPTSDIHLIKWCLLFFVIYMHQCDVYAISTWHHTFLIVCLCSLTSTSCLALLSVFLTAMISLTNSSLLLKCSHKGLLDEQRFELNEKQKQKNKKQTHKHQNQRSIVSFLLLCQAGIPPYVIKIP